MDAMNANEFSVMKTVLDLLTAKFRACSDTSAVVHPQNANNETMLIIAKHVSLKQVAEVKGKLPSRKRPVERKSARYSMGASCDSQPTDAYEEEETPSPPTPTYVFSTHKISSTEPFLISSTAGTSKVTSESSSK
jgi:hypothetical protein